MSILLTAAWLISFGGLPVEQQYTADSLIGIFTKDPKSPVKGATITFTDVVVETRVGRVVFRSSNNDKVFCELRAPIAKSSGGVAAGSPLTVVGRVRGRGALGNVTLDDCNVAVAAAVAIEPLLSLPPADVIPEPAPVPIEMPSVQVAEPPQKTVRSVAPRMAAATQKAVEREAAATSDTVPEPAAVPPEARATDFIPGLGLLRTGGIGLAVLGFVVGLLFIPLMKRMPSVLRRSQHHPVPTTPEMRRLALEALLSREQKKA